MSHDHIEDRYRHYRGEDVAGEVIINLSGGNPRRYGQAMLLTRLPTHPNPEAAPPAVVWARNTTAIVVLEKYDHPADTDRTVVDLEAARAKRRRGGRDDEPAS